MTEGRMKPLLTPYDREDDAGPDSWWPSWLVEDAVAIKVAPKQSVLTLNEADLHFMLYEIHRKREGGAL